jgi:MFS family permease
MNFEMLVAGRALQGLFGALLAPAALSLLTTTFGDSEERGTAFGVFGAVAGAGGAVGLLLGQQTAAVVAEASLRSYTTAFWWSSGIFAVGAGDLRTSAAEREGSGARGVRSRGRACPCRALKVRGGLRG